MRLDESRILLRLLKKKKDKKPYTLFAFQNHGDRKNEPACISQLQESVHLITVQGVWMLRSKIEHILYCAVHL